MPHWTTPNPHSADPTAGAAKAITSLQAELDKLFDKAASITSTELDALAAHVKTFYSEFEAHLATARKQAAAG
jgi:hypothetical protein